MDVKKQSVETAHMLDLLDKDFNSAITTITKIKGYYV